MASIRISDRRGGELADSTRQHQTILLDSKNEEEEGSPGARPEDSSSSPWGHWTIAILTHVLALVIGFLVAWFVFPRLLVVGVPIDPQTGRPMMDVAPVKPGPNGIEGGQPSIKNDVDKGKLREEPPAPKSDGVHTSAECGVSFAVMNCCAKGRCRVF